MKKKKFFFILLILVLLFLMIFSINFYFLRRLNDQQSPDGRTRGKYKPGAKMTKIVVDHEIILRDRVNKLKPVYRNQNPRCYTIVEQILTNLAPKMYDGNLNNIWLQANQWTDSNEVFPEIDDTIGHVMYAMQNEEITSVRNYNRGTQLKLMFTLGKSQQPFVFKPMWYSRKHICSGPVYAGKDRHISEIFSFYLSAVFDFRSTPIVIGRKINVKKLYSVADDETKLTMLDSTNETCYWGKCHYCFRSERLCGNIKNNFEMEGALIYLVPGKFERVRSPWQRTYKTKVKAEWEYNSEYCDGLKKIYPETRLLDLVDAAIFDFLIQNGDRHHYETRNDGILILDNGKGFGNPYIDHLDILAPLYQCCILRRKTWSRLLLFTGGTLTETIRKLSQNDRLDPILIDEHYDAVERRLLYVFSAVEFCMEKFGRDQIFR